MEESHFWILVSKQLAGEASEAEAKALKTVVDIDKNRQSQWKEAQRQWQAKQSLPKYDRSRARNLLIDGLANQRKTSTPAETEHTKKISWRRWWQVGAACLLIGFSLLVYQQISEHANQDVPSLSYKTISVPLGKVQKATLPDGTKVWLNAGSKLRYAQPFTQRNVQLKGEGFFDVVRNEDSPFTVHTQALQVRVLGTSFNVKHYDQEHTEVGVASGSVQVSLQEDSLQLAILSPSEGILLEKASKELLKTHYDLNTLSAWKEGKLVFKNEPLKDMIPKLERWYQVRIRLEHDALGARRFSGTFHQEKLSNILQIVHHAVCIEYEIDQQEVTITEGSCD